MKVIHYLWTLEWLFSPALERQVFWHLSHMNDPWLWEDLLSWLLVVSSWPCEFPISVLSWQDFSVTCDLWHFGISSWTFELSRRVLSCLDNWVSFCEKSTAAWSAQPWSSEISSSSTAWERASATSAGVWILRLGWSSNPNTEGSSDLPCVEDVGISDISLARFCNEFCSHVNFFAV